MIRMSLQTANFDSCSVDHDLSFGPDRSKNRFSCGQVLEADGGEIGRDAESASYQTVGEHDLVALLVEVDTCKVLRGVQ